MDKNITAVSIAWPQGQMIGGNPGYLTSTAPSCTWVMQQGERFFWEDLQSRKLVFANCNNGRWSSPAPVDGDGTAYQPNVAAFYGAPGTYALAYNSGGALKVTVGSSSWPAAAAVPGADRRRAANTFCCVWADAGAQNQLKYSLSTAATPPAWSAALPVRSVASTATPAAVYFNNTLYVFAVLSDGSIESIRQDGTGWGSPVQVAASASGTATGVTACATARMGGGNTAMFVFWTSRNGGQISYSTSTDGTNWSEPQPINGVDTASDTPSCSAIFSASVNSNSVLLAWRVGDRMFWSSQAVD